MPAPSPRFEAPTFEPPFVESLTSYVTLKCRAYRVRREDVFDVVQEALTTIYASVRMFRPEKGDFDAWARGVAMNVIRRHSRDAKRYGDRFSEYYPNVHDYAAQEPSPERCAQRTQARDAISNALKNLTAQQASVVVLFDIDDLSHKEIANDLEITEAASHMCHKRAHKRLAGCLDRELLSVMPLSLASCEDLPVYERRSRWTERSHYVGQLAALLMAVFCISSLNLSTINESTVMENRVLDQVENVAMYRLDQQTVHRDAPNGKPDPASTSTVRDISTTAKVVDKPLPRSEYVPRLSHKHEPNDPDRRPNGR